jgi:hypothetical protein
MEGDIVVSDMEGDCKQSLSDNDRSFGTITSHTTLEHIEEEHEYHNMEEEEINMEEEEIVVEEEHNLEDLQDHKISANGSGDVDNHGNGEEQEGDVPLEEDDEVEGKKSNAMRKWKIAGLAVAAAVVLRAGVEVLSGDDNDNQTDVAGTVVLHNTGGAGGGGGANAAASSAPAQAAAQVQASSMAQTAATAQTHIAVATQAAQPQVAVVAQTAQAHVAVAQVASHAAQ